MQVVYLIASIIALVFMWRILHLFFSTAKIVIGLIIVSVFWPVLGPLLGAGFLVVFWYCAFRGVRALMAENRENKEQKQITPW